VTRCRCKARPSWRPYGEVVREERVARIARASKLEQLWTRLTGDFEFMELCEFSFSDEVVLEPMPRQTTDQGAVA
jgi:hypothetical protein